uniref:Mitochondrial proton/calcium exchanger protein n=1 Tax=Compsopogon caeruleus TaxID=31354 RepID=A0A7S1TCZ3_9RHOD
MTGEEWGRMMSTTPGDSTERKVESNAAPASVSSDVNQRSEEEKDRKKESVTWGQRIRNPKLLVRAVIDGAKHFWSGMKLLAADVRVSYGILKRILKGKLISRRERNILVSTGADLARMVPFSFFIVVPFMEFALPFALMMFPNMLPSQFQDQMKKEEDLKRQLKLRIELAKYLRDVVEEKARFIQSSSKPEEVKKDAEILEQFLIDLREGKPVDESVVAKFARFFSDEFTIDGASRPQLVAMCRYMGIAHYGSDAILRYRLGTRINTIKQDDMQIMWEGGVDALSDDEVAKACRDRGIRTHEMSKKRQRRQLQVWLEQSQSKEIPATLMVLSRAFFYTEGAGAALAETISSLPQDVVDDVRSANVVMQEMSSEERLQEVRRQEKRILLDQERADREEEEKRSKVEKERKSAEAESSVLNTESASVSNVEFDALQKEKELQVEIMGSIPSEQKPASFPSPSSSEPSHEPIPAVETAPVSFALIHKDVIEASDPDAIRRLVETLSESQADSAVEKERQELELLKAELLKAQELLGDTAASDSQVKRLSNMIQKLEREIERVDRKVGLKLKLLDADNDGIIDCNEIGPAVQVIAGDQNEKLINEVIHRLDENGDGKIVREDFIRLLKEVMPLSEALSARKTSEGSTPAGKAGDQSQESVSEPGHTPGPNELSKENSVPADQTQRQQQ